MFNNDQPLTL